MSVVFVVVQLIETTLRRDDEGLGFHIAQCKNASEMSSSCTAHEVSAATLMLIDNFNNVCRSIQVWQISRRIIQLIFLTTTQPHTRNHFVALFSGTTWVSRCQKKASSGLYGSRGDIKGTRSNNPAGSHSIRTNQRPSPSSPHFLRQMPFLLQPSQFILAWDRHQICWLAYPAVAWYISNQPTEICD